MLCSEAESRAAIHGGDTQAISGIMMQLMVADVRCSKHYYKKNNLEAVKID